MLLAGEGFGSVAEQRSHSCAADRLPWILLLVDGWDGFTEEYDTVDHGRPVDTLLQLAREGGAMGIQIVITGDRRLLSGRAASASTGRVVLRLADRTDYAMADLPARSIPEVMPPGRAVLPDGLMEIQVALLDPDPSGPAQVAALQALAAGAGRPISDPDRLPFVVRPLPERVDLATCDHIRGGPLWMVVGVAGDAAATVGVDLGADGPGFLIAGPARSGRSTALRTVALSLISGGTRVALVLPRRSPLQSLAGFPGVVGVFSPADGEALRDAVAHRPLVVLVDDVHTMTDSAIEPVLTDLLRSDDGTRAVVAAGGSDELGVTFRGLSMAVRAARSGLLLQPGAADGDLLGVRIPRMTSTRVPGRGLLVVGGQITPVQTAICESDGLAARPEAPMSGALGRPTIRAESPGVMRPPGRKATGEIGREALRLARF
jgi:S-DNA-T family DNA segregation ATPase FtsK/SpoIIIE